MAKPVLKKGLIRPIKKLKKAIKASLPTKARRHLPAPPEPLRPYLPPPPKLKRLKRRMSVREWVITSTMRKRGIAGRLEAIAIHNLGTQDYNHKDIKIFKERKIGKKSIGPFHIEIPLESRGWKRKGFGWGSLVPLVAWEFVAPTDHTMRVLARKIKSGRKYYEKKRQNKLRELAEKHRDKPKVFGIDRAKVYKNMYLAKEHMLDIIAPPFDVIATGSMLVPAVGAFGFGARAAKAGVKSAKIGKTIFGVRKSLKAGKGAVKVVRTAAEVEATIDSFTDMGSAVGDVVKHTPAGEELIELEEALLNKVDKGVDLFASPSDQVAASKMGQRTEDFAEQKYAPTEKGADVGEYAEEPDFTPDKYNYSYKGAREDELDGMVRQQELSSAVKKYQEMDVDPKSELKSLLENDTPYTGEPLPELKVIHDSGSLEFIYTKPRKSRVPIGPVLEEGHTLDEFPIYESVKEDLSRMGPAYEEDKIEMRKKAIYRGGKEELARVLKKKREAGA